MKNNPTNRKIKFVIEIEGSQFTTYAYGKATAITNASYRYAKENDMEVALVVWKIKNGDIGVTVVREP